MDTPSEAVDWVAQYVDHNSKYRLAVCKQCQHAVWPQEIQRHFNGPKHAVSHRLITEITQVVNTWTQLIRDPMELTIPDWVEQLIPYLEFVRNGFLCDIDPESCRYICCTQEAIRTHIRQKHSISQYQRRGRPSQSQRAYVEKRQAQ